MNGARADNRGANSPPALLGAEVRGLLDIRLIERALLDKRRKDVRDSLVRERSEGLDLGLEFLDRLGRVNLYEVGDDLSREGFVLDLVCRGLPRRSRFLGEQFDLMLTERPDLSEGDSAVASLRELDDLREHFLLGGGLGGGGSSHSVSLSPFVRFGSS